MFSMALLQMLLSSQRDQRVVRGGMEQATPFYHQTSLRSTKHANKQHLSTYIIANLRCQMCPPREVTMDMSLVETSSPTTSVTQAQNTAPSMTLRVGTWCGAIYTLCHSQHSRRVSETNWRIRNIWGGFAAHSYQGFESNDESEKMYSLFSFTKGKY